MKLFKQILEIKSKSGDVHFRRFALIETTYFSIFFHRIYHADKDIHLHSHPWAFLSVILRGAYVEKNLKGLKYKDFLTFSAMNRDGFHKIECMGKTPVWSLFLAFGKRTPWYYLVDGEKIESEEYRRIKNTTGFSKKN